MTIDYRDDRISSILQGIAIRVEREVITPDPRFITRRTHRRHRRRRHELVSIAAALVVIAGAITASVVLPGSSTRTPIAVASYPVRFEHTRLVVKDLLEVQKNAATIAKSKITSLQLPVTSVNNSSIAFGDGRVWVLDDAGGSAPAPCGTLVAVNVASVKVSGSVPISLCPQAVAYGAGSVWVLSSQINVTGYQLVRVDPSTLTVRSTTIIDGGNGGITPQGDTGVKYEDVSVDGNDVIAAIQGPTGNGELFEVDATSGAIAASVTVPSADGPVTALGANNAAVWVGTANGWVLSFDPRSGVLSSGHRLGARIASLAASNSGAWVTANVPVSADAGYPGLDTLRLDPTTGTITKDTGLPMVFVSTDGTSVWVLSSAAPYGSAAGLVANIDPKTGDMNEQTELPVENVNFPNALGVYEGSAWVINDDGGKLTRVNP
jgi:ABC-type Co2+ transport system permease subunit